MTWMFECFLSNDGELLYLPLTSPLFFHGNLEMLENIENGKSHSLLWRWNSRFLEFCSYDADMLLG